MHFPSGIRNRESGQVRQSFSYGPEQRRQESSQGGGGYTQGPATPGVESW